jgi:hypothetical protein
MENIVGKGLSEDRMTEMTNNDKHAGLIKKHLCLVSVALTKSLSNIKTGYKIRDNSPSPQPVCVGGGGGRQ